jgi:glucose-6-phosphate dehydrogenase assembly protein OpcA
VIIDLPNTGTSAVNRTLVDLRETGGAIALGRVLTLVVVSEDSHAEDAIQAANDASREHPCRVVVLVLGERRGSTRLDAQIRVGGDAGASEVIVLRLYGPLADNGENVVVPLLLPDAPIVLWWHGTTPEHPEADPLARMAQRRITDASLAVDPCTALHHRADHHRPGDTDLAWSRITLWRALLAAALDQPPYEPVLSGRVTGASDSPSTDLMAAWLRLRLDCPIRRDTSAPGTGLISVSLDRPSGTVDLSRPTGRVATLTQPGHPDRLFSLPPRADRDCLAEELRRLDPDDTYADVLLQGLPLLDEEADTGSARV